MVSGCIVTGGTKCLPGLIVDLVAKPRGVDNGERDAGAFLVKLWGVKVSR